MSYEKKIKKSFINHKSYKIIFYFFFSLLFNFTVFFSALLRSALRLSAIFGAATLVNK